MGTEIKANRLVELVHERRGDIRLANRIIEDPLMLVNLTEKVQIELLNCTFLNVVTIVINNSDNCFLDFSDLRSGII